MNCKILSDRHTRFLKSLIVVWGLLASTGNCEELEISVRGISMSPTLSDGDLVMVRPNFESIEVGDLVLIRVVEFAGDYLAIRRVVAVPGDFVRIVSGEVMINGAPLPEMLSGLGLEKRNQKRSPSFGSGAYKLKVGSYFVVGDNLDSARDSRHFGPVQEENIVGVVTGTERSE